MRADQFYESRRADWERLARLLERGQTAVQSLSPAEVDRLGHLYRVVSSDLALAQRDFPGHPVTRYLNQLVARGHAVVYRSEPMAVNRLLRFVAVGFPQAFRRALPFTVVAALLLILPAVGAGLATAWQPEAAHWMLPPGAHHLIPMVEKQELWVDIPVEERPYASSFIMQNNIRVASLAFGSGVLAGLPTVWIMVYNGLLLGAITGLTAHHGVAFELWTFVIGHGVIELSVVCIAGGSGLMLGWAVIRPGLLSRRDALTVAARRAVRLAVGCMPLLVLAGLIEGFVSPAEVLPWQLKWGVGLVSGVCFYGYLLLAGRERRLRPWRRR